MTLVLVITPLIVSLFYVLCFSPFSLSFSLSHTHGFCVFSLPSLPSLSHHTLPQVMLSEASKSLLQSSCAPIIMRPNHNGHHHLLPMHERHISVSICEPRQNVVLAMSGLLRAHHLFLFPCFVLSLHPPPSPRANHFSQPISQWSTTPRIVMEVQREKVQRECKRIQARCWTVSTTKHTPISSTHRQHAHTCPVLAHHPPPLHISSMSIPNPTPIPMSASTFPASMVSSWSFSMALLSRRSSIRRSAIIGSLCASLLLVALSVGSLLLARWFRSSMHALAVVVLSSRHIISCYSTS